MHVAEVRKLSKLSAIHPEVPPEVAELGDYVGSTKQIIEYCTKSDKRIYYRDRRRHSASVKEKSDKIFHMLKYNFICPNMKKQWRVYSPKGHGTR